jgi:hypothetical protein
MTPWTGWEGDELGSLVMGCDQPGQM